MFSTPAGAGHQWPERRAFFGIVKTGLGLAIELTTNEMAEVLGVSTQRLHKLSSDGVVAPLRRGRWDAADVVQRYVTRLKDTARARTKSAADSRMRDARAKLLELKAAREAGELIELNEAVSVFNEICGDMIASLESLPARITRDPRERQKIQTICDGERQRLADRWGARAAEPGKWAP